MHEMQKSNPANHHPHKHVDGRRDVYGMTKMNEKDRHKGSSQTNRTDRDHRSSKSHGATSQIPGAIRICGDWSEHMSSNGKVYFFNNKTKLSQWERPKEWSSSRTVEARSKDKVNKSSNLHKASSKHSNEGSGAPGGSGQHSRQHRGTGQLPDAKKAQQLQQRHRTNHEGDRDYRTLSSNSSAKYRDYRDIDYRDSNSSRSADSRLSNSVDVRQRQDRDYRSSGQHENKPNSTSNSRNSQSQRDYNGKSASSLSNDSQHSVSQNDHKVTHANYADNSKDEGNLSNHTTPRSSSDAAKRDWHGEKKGSIDSNDSHETSSVANGNEDPSSTSALVQTLSSVLNQASTSKENNNDTSIKGNLKSALRMLLDAAVRNQHIPNNATNEAEPPEAVKSEEPPVKRKRTNSTLVDDHINNAAAVSQNAERVLTSLRPSFDERCIAHAQGWPADQLEKQSARICDDIHMFSVNHTSQLCATMKVARSQVRAAEIHSTLQEQRVLYLRQQIKDLEKSTNTVPYT